MGSAALFRATIDDVERIELQGDIQMKDESKTNASTTEAAPAAPKPAPRPAPKPRDPYIRAENEDDDGYDPYSDRRPEREPMFEADPWR